MDFPGVREVTFVRGSIFWTLAKSPAFLDRFSRRSRGHFGSWIDFLDVREAAFARQWSLLPRGRSFVAAELQPEHFIISLATDGTRRRRRRRRMVWREPSEIARLFGEGDPIGQKRRTSCPCLCFIRVPSVANEVFRLRSWHPRCFAPGCRCPAPVRKSTQPRPEASGARAGVPLLAKGNHYGSQSHPLAVR